MKQVKKEERLLKMLVLVGLVLMLGQAAFGSAAGQGLSITQLVTSGQSVTLQAPSGDYYYEWTADVKGKNIGAGSEQRFTFTAPETTQDETLTVTLLIRTIEGGCVNSASTSINVYPLPVCGIGGPSEAGPYERAKYSYTGGTTGTLTYVWSVDGTTVPGASGPEVEIDWSNYAPGRHTVGLSLTKDYSDLAPGSTNPFRTITCSYPVEITYTSGLQLTKVPSVTEAQVGATVTYTYTLENTGSIGINSLTLKDDKVGDITLPVSSLKPGESTSVTVEYIIPEIELPGPLVNTATASGTEDKTDKPISTEASASIDLTYTSSLEVTKVPSQDSAAIGETVTYSYTILNTGSTTLSTLALNDNRLGDITLDKTTLAPGESAIGTATYTVKESDLPGPLTNTATATAKDSQDKDVTGQGTATVELTYTSSLEVTKVPSVTSAAIGETITYSYTVLNTGSTTLSTLALNDNRLGDITLDKTTLAPGESAIGTATYTVKESDLPGPLTNTATATAKDSQDKDVTGQATATVELTYTLSMEVTKYPSAESAAIGETVTYTYTVRNTGSITIRELTLIDDVLGEVSIEKTELAPGESVSGTASHIVTADDLPGPLSNTVTATAISSATAPVTAPAGGIRETITSEATALVKITREGVEPILECIHLNDDGKTYTAFFSYRNPNPYAVSIPIGNDNKITPKPDDQGQPTTFEPGLHTGVLAIVSDVNALVWHLDQQTATANKNSQRCSVAPCGIDGPEALCTNKVEEYYYTPTEDPDYPQTYEWFMDGTSLGSGKSIEISGEGYSLGEHTLTVKVTRSHLGKVWSVTECSMSLKVIPEPVVDITMMEEAS